MTTALLQVTPQLFAKLLGGLALSNAERTWQLAKVRQTAATTSRWRGPDTPLRRCGTSSLSQSRPPGRFWRLGQRPVPRPPGRSTGSVLVCPCGRGRRPLLSAPAVGWCLPRFLRPGVKRRSPTAGHRKGLCPTGLRKGTVGPGQHAWGDRPALCDRSPSTANPFESEKESREWLKRVRKAQLQVDATNSSQPRLGCSGC